MLGTLTYLEIDMCRIGKSNIGSATIILNSLVDVAHGARHLIPVQPPERLEVLFNLKKRFGK
jgi:hypothetical protein